MVVVLFPSPKGVGVMPIKENSLKLKRLAFLTSYNHIFAVLPISQAVEHVQRDLGLLLAEEIHLGGEQAHFLSEYRNVLGRLGAGDLNI